MNNYYHYLILSGGGIKGIGLMGALQVLDEHKCLDTIHTYVGSSIGAMIAVMMVIGYTPQEIYDMFFNLNYTEMQEINIWNLFSEYGLDKASKIVKYFKTLFRAKSYGSNITFAELYNTSKKRLIVTGTCVNTHKIEYFDDITTPTMKVIDAVRISFAFPFLFTAPKYKGNHYTDGGMLDNFPLMSIQGYIQPNERVLALKLNHMYEKTAEHTINSLEIFSLHVIYTLLDDIDRLRQQVYDLQNKRSTDDRLDILLIETDGYHSIQFDIDQKDRDKLFNCGRYQAARFLEDLFEKRDSQTKIDTTLSQSQ